MMPDDRTKQPRVVVVVGPTGVGKSQLAVELAEHFGGEIITADSMQVYKFMDIGTDKPSHEAQRKVQHHLIDLVFPDEPFHAGIYRALGQAVIADLHRARKPIWVVGGTGLYIKVLTQGLFPAPAIDPDARERLKREARERGNGFLYGRLRQLDRATAERVHPNDLFRITRALEVFESTGIPISLHRDQHRFGDRPFSLLKVGLEMERSKLYRRIEERVDRMIEQGFLEEVCGLLEKGYGPQLKPMQSLGYKQFTRFLLKEIGWDEAVHRVKRETRHYAKRQWTWFKTDPEVRWQERLADGSLDRRRIVKEVASFLEGGG